MTTQPDALRLADMIQSRYGNDINDEAAAELRRLFQENEEAWVQNRGLEDRVEAQQTRIAALETALGQAVEALEFYEQVGVSNMQSCEALATARQTLGGAA